MDNLINYAKRDRNPVEESRYQEALRAANIPFTVEGGRTNVTGFGFGGNDYGSAAAAFFSPAAMSQRAARQQAEAQQQALVAKQDAQNKDFLGRVQGIPSALSAIEQEVGLPQARATYQSAGETARLVANTARDIAPTQNTIAKQVGISAPRLQQRIGAETVKLSPALEAATRGLESAQAGLEGTLSNFSTRAANVLAPYQIEAGVLGESIKNEFDVYKTNLAANLDRELAQLQQTGLNDRAALDRAAKLAEIENATISGEFRDLGDRVALINPATGQEIQSFKKGLEPKRDTIVSSIDGW